MVNHDASFIEKDKIPLIDISGINDNIKIIEVSKLLHKASKEIGKLLVKNSLLDSVHLRVSWISIHSVHGTPPLKGTNYSMISNISMILVVF